MSKGEKLSAESQDPNITGSVSSYTICPDTGDVIEFQHPVYAWPERTVEIEAAVPPLAEEEPFIIKEQINIIGTTPTLHEEDS